MENPSVQKEKLRKTLCLLTKQQDPAELDKESRLICNKLEGSPEFKEAQNLLLYYSLPDEVSTLELIRRWYKHKNILLPVIVNESTMVLRLYTGKNALLGRAIFLRPFVKKRDLTLRRKSFQFCNKFFGYRVIWHNQSGKHQPNFYGKINLPRVSHPFEYFKHILHGVFKRNKVSLVYKHTPCEVL